MNDLNEERIDLLYLLYRCAKSWRLMIVLVLVCMFVVNAAFCLRTFYSEPVSLPTDMSADSGETLELYWREGGTITISETKEMKAIADKLSKRELEIALGAVTTGLEYRAEIRDMEYYMGHSLKMRADAGNVSAYTLRYFIDDKYQTEYPIIEKKRYVSSILNAYIDLLNTTEVITEIGGILGIDAEYGILSEAIYAYGSGESFFFTVCYVETDEQQRAAVKQVVEKAMDRADASMHALYGDFDVTLVSEEYKHRLESELYARQREQNTALNNLRTQYMSVGTAGVLSADQKTFIKLVMEACTKQALAETGNAVQETAEQAPQTVRMQSTAPARKPKLIQGKYLALGALVGFMISALIVCWKVVMCGILTTGQLLANTMKISDLGSVKLKNAKKKPLQFVDDWLDRAYYKKILRYSEADHIEMICSRIRLYAQKNGYEQVALISSVSDPSVKVMENKIREGLKGRLSVTVCERPIMADPAELERMVSVGCVVLIELTGSSLISDIREEVTLCRENEKPIVGCVTLCA